MPKYVKLIGPDKRVWHVNDHLKKRIGKDLKYCNLDGSDIVDIIDTKKVNIIDSWIGNDVAPQPESTRESTSSDQSAGDSNNKELSEDEKIDFMVNLIPSLPREKWNVASVKNNMTPQPGKFLYKDYCNFEVTKDMVSKAWAKYNSLIVGKSE